MLRGGARFPWQRAVAEFFVIVLGVLVALGADAWNDVRLDRNEEQEYLSRLHHELQRDTSQYGFILGWMDRKEAGLDRVDRFFKGTYPAVSDTAQFLSALAASSNFGWNVGPLGGRATYEDLRSSGKLGLIRDHTLRASIIAYYESADSEDRRIEARKTEYPRIAYRLVPSARTAEPGRFGASEQVAPDDFDGLLRTIRSSDLASHSVAERNRALFIRNVVSGLRVEAVQLLEDIAMELERRL